MGVQQVNLQLTLDALQGLLSDVLFQTTGSAYKGELAGVYLGLFVAPYPGWSFNLQMSQLVEANFGGYARQLTTWSAQGIDPSGRPEVYSQAVLWQPTSSVAANVVLGMFLADALTVGRLLAVGLFPGSLSLGTPTDQATVVARLAMPLDPANWGLQAVIN